MPHQCLTEASFGDSCRTLLAVRALAVRPSKSLFRMHCASANKQIASVSRRPAEREQARRRAPGAHLKDRKQCCRSNAKESPDLNEAVIRRTWRARHLIGCVYTRDIQIGERGAQHKKLFIYREPKLSEIVGVLDAERVSTGSVLLIKQWQRCSLSMPQTTCEQSVA